jgi:glutathione S-transferase
MEKKLMLVSHDLCPFVQRAAIVLLEKGADFERRNVDLANKPDWFLELSPLGKTPLLLVKDQVLFESAAICEYLDETLGLRMHPSDPIERAQHRAWMEFGSSILSAIVGFYNAADEQSFESKRCEIAQKFERIEATIGAGPFFSGTHFSLVDAVFAPIFGYCEVFDAIDDFNLLVRTPRVRRWRTSLRERASVRSAVQSNFNEQLLAFLQARNGVLARRIEALSQAG